MTRVEVHEAVKDFEGVRALDGVDLEVSSGSFSFLLGPSGCGKTTLLRAIAGLTPLDEGRILFDGSPVDHVPAHKRQTAMVFQNYALWPHMSVFENVAFGLRERKVPRKEVSSRVAEALEMVRLSALADRRPAELSGGQQQRVALARALVVRPKVVLLDEPLSNLDAHLRRQMRYELKRIHRDSGVTMIYVTHDQVEALSMADQVAVMRAGRVVQRGRPEEVYRRPASVFVAKFVGRTNLLAGEVVGTEGEWVQVATKAGVFWGLGAPGLHVTPGASVFCSIRPEAIRWRDRTPAAGTQEAGTDPAPARLAGRLSGRLFLGEVEERVYDVAGLEVVAVGLPSHQTGTVSGGEADLEVSARDVVVLAPDEPEGVGRGPTRQGGREEETG